MTPMNLMRRCLPAGLLALAVLAPAWAFAQPSWDELRAFYAYDAALPLNVRADEPVDRGAMTIQTVRFDSPEMGPHGPAAEGNPTVETVPAALCLPKGNGPWPVVLFLHGLGGSRNDAATALAPLACPLGIAVLSTDAQHHGERKREGVELFSADVAAMVAGVRQSITDNRRALDYIASHPDLDAKRVVLIGASMGGIMGSIVTALDERVTGAFLIVGGGDWETLVIRSEIEAARAVRAVIGDIAAHREALAFVEPVNFAAHIAPRPLHMLNGRDDRIVPAACGQALFDAAREPKRIVWYEGGAMEGHFPPLDMLFSEVFGFLQKQGLAGPQ